MPCWFKRIFYPVMFISVSPIGVLSVLRHERRDFCTLMLRAVFAIFCVAKWHWIRKKQINLQMSRSTQQFGVLYRWKNWRVREQRSAKALPLPKRGHGGAILRVRAALGRRVASQRPQYGSPHGVCFVVQNLVFPRLFLLGVSLKSALYWEIGVKSTALQRIKAFVCKMYLFFFFFLEL